LNLLISAALPSKDLNDVVVLLTATVSPNSPRLAGVVADESERRSQYIESIRVWSRASEQFGFRLAVVETSGESRESLLRLVDGAPERIQTVTFLPDDRTVSRGKGAAELAAVQFALGQLTACTDETAVYKVTGRLMLRNPEIIRHLEPDDVLVRMTLDRSFADTRILGASKRVWMGLFADTGVDLDDDSGLFLEHFIAGQVARASALKQVRLQRFSSRPEFIGTSGQSGLSYDTRRPRIWRRLGRIGEDFLSWLGSRKQV